MTGVNLVNPEAAEVDRILKMVEAFMVPLAERAIQTAFPEAALPVIKQVADEIVQGTANALTKEAEEGTTFLAIDHEVSQEESSLNRALVSLIKAQKGGDPNAIQAAIKAYSAAHAALASDDGGAAPL